MPITNASNLIRFADGTGAEIPRWIRKQLATYGDDTASIKAFGHEVIIITVRTPDCRWCTKFAFLHHEQHRTDSSISDRSWFGLSCIFHIY